jgi:outer membrane protein OmpA-like peptidoglycan-associated protein
MHRRDVTDNHNRYPRERRPHRHLGSNATTTCRSSGAAHTRTMNALEPAARVQHRLAPLALALLTLVVGCAAPTTRQTGAGAESAPAAPSTRPEPPVSPLVVEKRWLDEWFHGTPVVIALHGDSALHVEVPLAHSFAAGSSTIKPALAAVLDRVATSLRRQAGTRVSIAAAADVGGAAAQASNRTQQVRDHLVARGVPGARISSLGIVRAGEPVQLQIVVAAQPISRLDDRALPVPAAAVKPTAATPESAPRR